jgi:DnaJ-class molecular chaperone
MIIAIAILILAVGIFLISRSESNEQRSQEVHTCPRCLGKGHVDDEDIRRLNMKGDWIPGKCMYCYGNGKVLQRMIEKVPVDEYYLNTSLDEASRKRFLEEDPRELSRAVQVKTYNAMLKDKVLELHTLQDMSPEKIANELIMGRYGIPASDRELILEWIKSVVATNGERT